MTVHNPVRRRELCVTSIIYVLAEVSLLLDLICIFIMFFYLYILKNLRRLYFSYTCIYVKL